MINNKNLKPFTGANDPRRQNGRKKGSKNLSTIVRELLDEPINQNFIDNKAITGLLGNSQATYSKALALAMIIKAINGDVRAATWVVSFIDDQSEEEGFFERTNFTFNVVPYRPIAD